MIGLMAVILAVVVILALAVAMYRWLSRSTSAINDYFRNAVMVHGLLGDEAARVAALTAATVAAERQRRSMVTYLRAMASDAAGQPNGAAIGQRLINLADEIAGKGTSLEEVRAWKERLGALSPDYLAALNRPDPSVFARKWPSLFE